MSGKTTERIRFSEHEIFLDTGKDQEAFVYGIDLLPGLNWLNVAMTRLLMFAYSL